MSDTSRNISCSNHENVPQSSDAYQLPRGQVTFPISAFPDVIRQAVIDVDATLGGGVELGAAAALGVVSVVCQEFINVLRPKLEPSSCSLFLVTIAGTGAGKSEIQRRFMRSLETFEREEEQRANAASDEHASLTRVDRLRRLDELRVQRGEVLVEFDDLCTKDDALKKEASKRYHDVRVRPPKGGAKDDAIKARQERQREWQVATGRARGERDDIRLRLNSLRDSIVEIEQKIRSTMGPNARRLVYERGSFAGFRNGLQDKCRSAGIISAEAGGILNSPMLARNMGAWNDLWGCEFYRETYDKREYVIDAPRLTLALMLQPKQFESFVDHYGESALDNGFFSRILVSRVPPQQPRLAGGEDDSSDGALESLSRFHKRVGEILEQDFPWIEKRATLRMTKAARQYWESYYNTLVTAQRNRLFDEKMGGFVLKLPEQAARIAALFHYFSCYPIAEKKRAQYHDEDLCAASREIPLDTMRAATRLCDWYMAEFQKNVLTDRVEPSFSSWGYSTQVRSNADRILGTIRRHYRKYESKQQRSCIRLMYRDIQHANRTIKSKADILAALHYLAGEHCVHLGYGKNGGVFICYNPNQQYPCMNCHSQRQSVTLNYGVQQTRAMQMIFSPMSLPNSTESSQTEPQSDQSENVFGVAVGSGQDDASETEEFVCGLYPEGSSLFDAVKMQFPTLFESNDAMRASEAGGSPDEDVDGE
ncbi:DUF3987 domain-containing protein [Pandoraea soli]|uniref:DUF3987 domain-containing protein n=1 Tax=Pandoraea soli TaxID=2508293 RepID=A0ABY6W9G3_9BURK|nr:DUF3987 domain-containing protein [Pandoraea soli]VVE15671.1 hypothetical protein PSO31014_02853 [Pandoraea soli]